MTQTAARLPSSFQSSIDDSGRLRLIIMSLASVFYALAVLWYVLTFPDLGIRCLLPDDPPGNKASQIVVTQFVNTDADCIPYMPQPNDVLLEINRQPVDNFLDFVAILSELRFAGIPPGGQLAPGSDPAELANEVPGLVEIRGSDPDAPATRMVEIRFMRPGTDSQTPLTTFVAVKSLRSSDFLLTAFWFGCQLVILVVGLTAHWRRPNAPIVRTFCVMCAVSMVAFVGGFHWWIIASSPLLNLPFICCAILLPASTLHFFCSFPQDNAPLRTHPRKTLASIYVPLIAVVLLVAFVYWTAFSLSSPVDAAGKISTFQKLVSVAGSTLFDGKVDVNSVPTSGHLLYLLRNLVYLAIGISTVYFAVTVVVLTLNLLRTQNVLERRQATSILVASLISTLPICYTLYLAFYRKDEFALGAAQVPMFVASGLFMAAYAHGMLRHRLILADEILERGRQYSIMSGVVTIGISTLIAVGITISQTYSLQGNSSLLLRWSMFVLLVLATSFVLWIRDRIQATVDRRFFSEKYQLDKTLQQLNQAAGHLTDPSAMAELTLQTCRDVIDVSTAAMYVKDSSGAYRLIGLHNNPEIPATLPGDALGNDAPLGHVVQRSPSSGKQSLSREQQLLREMSAELLCLLQDEGGIDGLIFVGRRASGTPYSAEDIAFLQAISQMTVLALHSSRANQNLARLNSELKVKVDRIAEQQRQLAMLRAELTSLQSDGNQTRVPDNNSEFDRAEIRGNGAEILDVLHMAKKAASSPSTVLIRGESGTGKELLARVIHRNSDRNAKPLVTVNCAALAPSLLESELFGHVRGAFTGANSDKVGRFQAAHQGTLFLDEIGDISLETQVKLLRVLQERCFEPVGSNQSVNVDVRLITATHRNLEQMIADGLFREDLYYRLNVVSITLPPLRDRREDLIELVFHFLNRALQKTGKQIRQIAPEALTLLEQHSWPGNIRELENTIERSVVLSDGDVITIDDLPEEVRKTTGMSTVQDSKQILSGAPQAQKYESPIAESPEQIVTTPKKDATREIAQLKDALELAEGNKARAARLLNMPRSTYYSKLKKYGIGD